MPYSLPDTTQIGWRVRTGRRGSTSADVWDTAQWDIGSWDGGTVVDFSLIPEALILGFETRGGKGFFGKRFRATSVKMTVDNSDGVFTNTDSLLQPGDYVHIQALVNYPTGLPDATIPPGTTWLDAVGNTWTAHGDLTASSGTSTAFVYDVFYGRVDSAIDSVINGRDVTRVVMYDGFAELAPINKDAVLAEGAGDTVFQRIDRIGDNASLAYGGFVPSNAPAEATMQDTTLAQGALDMMHLTVESEGGDMWAAKFPGVSSKFLLQVRARDWLTLDSKSINIQFVLGGTQGLVLTNARVSRDQQLLINDATISNAGGVAQNSTDADSVQRYGPRTTRRLDLIAQDDTQAQYLAQRFVRNLKDVRPRVREVTVPGLDELSILFAATVEYGDLVLTTVNSVNGWAYTALGHVIGIRRTVFEQTWTTTLILDDAFVDNVDGAYDEDEFSVAFTLGTQEED